MDWLIKSRAPKDHVNMRILHAMAQRRDTVLLPPPRMSNPPFKVFLIFWYESVFLPTKLAFHLCWASMRERMQVTWQEGAWTRYVLDQYLHTEVAGETPWISTWHCASLHVPGQSASQQPAELLWRLLTHGLQTQPRATHVDLASGLNESTYQTDILRTALLREPIPA